MMVANRVGALAVTSAQDKGSIIGVISERDFVNKVALLGKSAKGTNVNEVCTLGAANLITVVENEPVEECMKKVLASDVRHLLLKDNSGKIVSMLSVKDLVKCVVAKHQELVSRLTDFGTGKGAFFGSE
jgi:CBS domain-containing protein